MDVKGAIEQLRRLNPDAELVDEDGHVITEIVTASGQYPLVRIATDGTPNKNLCVRIAEESLKALRCPFSITLMFSHQRRNLEYSLKRLGKPFEDFGTSEAELDSLEYQWHDYLAEHHLEMARECAKDESSYFDLRALLPGFLEHQKATGKTLEDYGTNQRELDELKEKSEHEEIPF